MTSELSTKGRARVQRLGAAIATSFVSKVGSVAYQIVAVPLVIASLGVGGYSKFAVVMAAFGWMGTLSVGFGPTVTEKIVSDRIHPISPEVRETFMTALAASAALLGVVLVVTVPLLAQQDSGGSSDGSTFAIAGLASAMAISGAVFDSALLGFQRAHVTNLFSFVSSVLALAATILAARLFPTVSAMVIAALGPVVLARGMSAVALHRAEPSLFGRLRDVKLRAVPPIARRGIVFAGIALAAFLELQGGLLVAAAQLGSTNVAEAALVLRALPLLSSVVAMITVPLWPAVAEAVRDGDIRWVRKAWARASALVMIYAIAASLIVIVAGQWILGVWTGGRVSVSNGMLVAAGLLIVLESWANVNVTLLIAIGRAGSAAAVLLVEAVVGVLLVGLGTSALGQGAALVGPVIPEILICSWLLPLLVVRAIRRTSTD